MTLFDELDLALGNLATVQGILPADLLNLPEIIGQTLGKMVRKQGMNLNEFAAEIGLSETEALYLVDILVAKGYLVEEEGKESQTTRYRTFFARMRSHHMPLDL
jgi:hypothetical protein